MKDDSHDIDAVIDDFTDLWIDDPSTITVNSADIWNSSGTVTSSILGPYSNHNIGAVGSTGGPYITTTNNTWGGYSNQSAGGLKVAGEAVFEGKVMINGRNISEFMETISKRLAILVPDPEKLEHFEALKKAYDHYKLLEALCELPTETKE